MEERRFRKVVSDKTPSGNPENKEAELFLMKDGSAVNWK